MSIKTKSVLSSLVLLIISACGGGGSSNSSPSTPATPTITNTQIIANAGDYSAAELKQAAESIVSSNYKGLVTPATMDIIIAQQTFLRLFEDSEFELPELVSEDLTGLSDGNGNVDKTLPCYYQGTVSFRGNLDVNTKGHLSLTFDSCEQRENDFPMSGKAAVVVTDYTATSLDIAYHYDNLQWEVDGNSIKLSGYSKLTSDLDLHEEMKGDITSNILFEIGESLQLRFDGDIHFNEQYVNAPNTYSGDFYFSDKGKVTVELEGASEFPPYIHQGRLQLVGDKSVAFDFEKYPQILYLEDSNGDQKYDEGTYFSGVDELIRGNPRDKSVVALNELSLPPSVGRPRFNTRLDVDTTTPVIVEAGTYSDPDNDVADLTVSYRWYINGEIVEGQTDSILPPYNAVYGDALQVSMLVSDGSNNIESSKLTINLDDAAPRIEVSGLPDSIFEGDSVEFTVQVIDPDLGATDASSMLIAGPKGVNLNENGLLTWDVPNNLLFPIQNFEFTFGSESEGVENDLHFSMEVRSDKSFPITKSGINVPFANKSMFVGDFDGDGNNEVLSTNSKGSVFLLEHNQGEYKQKWLYPFKLPSAGNIVQVIPVNTDDDNSLEVLVITENGISLINGLDKMATPLLTTQKVIKFATIRQLDEGSVDIAYLTEESHSSSILNVVSLNEPEISLFSTNVSDARQVEFANVDDDQNIELVINNGLVYDTATWENQWYSGTSFGNRSVTSGDYDGDGIAEIAGADTWGNVYVYDAVDKSQLYSFDNFNTCTLHSADVDNDNADELIVGDCQWGEITAYKLENNVLIKLWSVNMQSHGSVSLTSGDSDNDGDIEIHWGTGTSHSGANGFITADIVGQNAIIKEQAESVQLDSYSAAGWANIIDEDERAVFHIPKTGSGYDGNRFLVIDKNGNVDLSEELGSNWDRSSYAVTTDFNNDGLGDIFIPNTHLYNGSLAAVQLMDNMVHWQTGATSSSTIGLIKAADLNNDGYDDAIYIDGRQIKAVDVVNQKLIANYTFNSYISDFVAFMKNGIGTVIAISDNKLHHLSINGGVFSQVSFVDSACSRIRLINYDDDSEKEVVCLSGEYSFNAQYLAIYEIEDDNLVGVASKEVTTSIVDIAVDPTTSNNQNVYLAVQKNGDYFIQKTSSLGLPIWTSPAIVGQPTKHGLKVRTNSSNKLELMLSTTEQMYWIK